jgi:hypothetical protein
MVELIDTASLSLAAERRTGLSPVGGIRILEVLQQSSNVKI